MTVGSEAYFDEAIFVVDQHHATARIRNDKGKVPQVDPGIGGRNCARVSAAILQYVIADGQAVTGVACSETLPLGRGEFRLDAVVSCWAFRMRFGEASQGRVR